MTRLRLNKLTAGLIASVYSVLVTYACLVAIYESGIELTRPQMLATALAVMVAVWIGGLLSTSAASVIFGFYAYVERIRHKRQERQT